MGDPIALTVLLVDDDPDMRLYLRTCLRSPSLDIARVLEAADGVEALQLTRAGGVLLRVVRPAAQAADPHPSEAEQGGAAFAQYVTAELVNDGALADLPAKVRAAVAALGVAV